MQHQPALAVFYGGQQLAVACLYKAATSTDLLFVFSSAEETSTELASTFVSPLTSRGVLLHLVSY
jgi:hypothetical protein